MSNVKITVGGAIEDDASQRFVNAWHRAERGETFHERHLAHKVTSVRALAKALGRDYSNVHADAQALSAAGLLDAVDGGLQADYDVIETKIAI